MLSAVDGGKHPICFSQCPTNLFLFQSTHPSGVRPQWHGRYHRRQLISIHAPQWGATSMAWPVSSAAAYFNPRTPVGCDTGVERILFEHGEFQSTHPSGVRRGSQGAVIQYWDISIHAPQWGATTSSALLTSGEQFQSTHPSGVRRYSESTSIFHLQFQSTHPSGVRREQQSGGGVSEFISIHAPQWGATGGTRNVSARPSFQSTHPSGVRLAPRNHMRGAA